MHSHILIVEDEPILRENLQMLLELEGYSVQTASNGLEGLIGIRGKPRPCLVLLDLLMPIMTGTEFLQVKNDDVEISTVPVCVVSGVADKPNLSNIMGFIKKPIDIDRLLRIVEKYCCAKPENKNANE